MTPSTFAVLRLLSDGEFHSGEALARRLELSRASVWNALRGVEQWGVSLYKVRGRGYRLEEPVEWLDEDRIREELSAAGDLFRIEVLEAVDSTNAYLLGRAASGAESGSVVAAEVQTQGRGRRGRSWQSGLGGGLTFSLLWRFEQGAGFLSGLSLAAALGVVRALDACGVAGTVLKWPNDILHRYRKLAGILIEAQGDVLGPTAAVIGIGINLKLPDAVRERIDQAVTDVYSITGRLPERNCLLAAVLQELARILLRFQEQGFKPFRQEWNARHAYHGRPVRVLLPGGAQVEGVIEGVEESGALVLRTGAGKRTFTTGELSLRGAR